MVTVVYASQVLLGEEDKVEVTTPCKVKVAVDCKATVLMFMFELKPLGPNQVYEVTPELVVQLRVAVFPAHTMPELVGVTIHTMPQLVVA